LREAIGVAPVSFVRINFSLEAFTILFFDIDNPFSLTTMVR